MSNWVPFYVTELGPPPTQTQDGQVNFIYTITTVNGVPTMSAGAQMLYAPNNSPTPPNNSQIVFTTAAAIPVSNNGSYDLPSVTFSNATKVHIPHVSIVPGGTYNTLMNLVFNPGNNQLSGTFKEIGITGGDPDCDWVGEVGA